MRWANAPIWSRLVLIGLVMAAIWAFAFGLRYPLSVYGGLPMQSLATLNRNSLESALLYIGAFGLLFALYLIALRVVQSGSNAVGWVIIGIAILMNAVMLPMHPMDAADVYDYIIRGRMTAFYGLNPMQDTPERVPQDDTYEFVAWKEANSAYGPAWEVMAAATARLAGNDVHIPENRNMSVIAFKLLSVLGYLVTLVGVAWTLAKVAPERIAIGMLLFAWNPLMVYFAGGTGHNDLWLAAALVLAIGCMVRGWYTAAITVTVLGALIKFIPVLLLPVIVIVVWRSVSMRVRLRVFLAGGVLGAALIIVFYRPFWVGFESLALDRRGRLFTSSIGTLARQALEPVFAAQAGSLVNIFALGSLGLFTCWQLWLLMRKAPLDPLDGARALLRILLFYLLVAAIWFQHWYLAWVIPLAALLDDSPLRRLTLVFGYLVTWQPLLYNYVTLRYDGWMDAPWRDLIPVSVFMGGAYIYAIAGWLNRLHIRNLRYNQPPSSSKIKREV